MNLPFASIIIGAIISGSIWFNNREINIQEQDLVLEDNIIEINPITNDDNIRGNPNAPVTIVEYSDYQCPFCQDFHNTMRRIMDEYGKTGQVSWVYRHFPLQSIHPLAKQAALASECVKNLANDKGLDGGKLFWNFSDSLFLDAPDSLTLESMQIIAENLGIDQGDLAVCISSERYMKKIERDLLDIAKLSQQVQGIGTPFNIVISRNGTQVQINGNESYENLVILINTLLTQ